MLIESLSLVHDPVIQMPLSSNNHSGCLLVAQPLYTLVTSCLTVTSKKYRNGQICLKSVILGCILHYQTLFKCYLQTIKFGSKLAILFKLSLSETSLSQIWSFVDFGVKNIGREENVHLMLVLKQQYTVEEEQKGELQYDITLRQNHKKGIQIFPYQVTCTRN